MEQLPDLIQNQIQTIDESKQRILMLLTATFLSYYTVDIQRQQLICTATDEELCRCLPETFPLQTASSIIVIGALLYFTKLSKQTLALSATPKETCRNSWNHLANLLVLLAALIRFALLLDRDPDFEEE